MKNMTIRTKIIFAFSTLIFLLLLEGAFLFQNTDHIYQQSLAVKDKYEPTVSKAYELKIAVIQIQQWLTDISATRGLDGLNDGFDLAEKHYKSALTLVDELRTLDAENADMYQKIKASLSEYYASGVTMAQAYVDHGPAGGNPQMETFDTSAATISEQVNSVMALAKAQSILSLEEESSSTLQLERTVVIYSVIFLIMIVAMAIFSVRSILIPIKALSDVAEDLAQGDGDLTKRLDASRSDEIGTAAGWINKFIEKSQNTIRTLSNVSSETNVAVSQLADIADRAYSGMNQQLQDSEQLSTAMHQVLASAQEISQNSASTSNQITTVQQNSSAGIVTINAAVSGITDLVSEMDKAQEVIKQLGDESNNIGSVLDVIKGISEQTNLLALNAAIEAARAGEQGRGFAVVADEVRTLAGRTQQATEEIQSMITSLQQKTNRAIEVINQGSGHAYDSVNKVNEANESLINIGQNIEQISQMSIQIATAAEEQCQVSGEVDNSISHIANTVRNSSERVTMLHGTSDQLTRNVQQLDKLIGQFRV